MREDVKEFLIFTKNNTPRKMKLFARLDFIETP